MFALRQLTNTNLLVRTGLIAACILGMATAWMAWRARADGHELATIKREQAELHERIVASDRRRQDMEKRLATVDAENQGIIEEIASGAMRRTPGSARQLTRENIEARYRRGKALEREGDAAGALAEYLWCYDTGFRGISDLLKRIRELGKTFSPAREALYARRDLAERRVLAEPEDVETLSDVIALNQLLGESARTLELVERLPRGNGRPGLPEPQMLALLIETRRYTDAARLRPYEHLSQTLASGVQSLALKERQPIPRRPPPSPEAQKQQAIARERALQAQRQAVVIEGAVGVEILAGAGDVLHARELAQKVLEFDGTPETRALVQKHAERAGHADLLQ